MVHDPVLSFTDRGIYCAAGNFYIDPWRPVDRALITHGHSDHARAGHARYLSSAPAGPVLKHRLGDISLETIAYGETRQIGNATVSFHPAGHVPGSAQIRVEVGGEVWVASGDYKTEPDGLCEPFAPVRCHSFITESTFGLPVFHWQPQAQVGAEINRWWRDCQSAGVTPLLGAYALGKAQRLLAMLDTDIGPVLTHGSVAHTTEVLRAQGYALPDTIHVTTETRAADYPGALVLAPPSALAGTWARRFGKASRSFASGWMQMRGVRRRRALDRGFVVSDHADWAGLNTAIRATGAENIYVTHGYTEIFARWLTEQGLNAHAVTTGYTGLQDDSEEST